MYQSLSFFIPMKLHTLLLCLLLWSLPALAQEMPDTTQRTPSELSYQVDSLRIQLEIAQGNQELEYQKLRLQKAPIEEVMGLLTGMLSIISIAYLIYFTVSSRSKERMYAIEKGVDAETLKALYSRNFSFKASEPSGLQSLRWGLLAICAGLGALISHSLYPNYGDGIFVFLGTVMGAGLGLIIYYFIAEKKQKQMQQHQQ